MPGALHLELELARATDAGDPLAFRAGPAVYVARWQGGAYREARLDWDEALLREIAALQHEAPAPEIAASLGARLGRMLAAAGWDEAARAVAEAARAGRPVVLDLRAAAGELYALPWELLPVAPLGQPLGALPTALVRYAWPERTVAADARAVAQDGGRLLLAWSAAGGPVPAGPHQRALARACAQAGLSLDPTDVLGHSTLDALVGTLDRALREGRPFTTLHLLCHGAPGGGLLLDDGGGGPIEIGGDALARAMAPFAATLRFVTLCACHGADDGGGRALGSAAQHLHRVGFASVLASRLPLSIAGATTLTEALYGPLLSGLVPTQDAVRAARQALAQDPRRLDWASLALLGADDDRPVLRRPYRGLLPFLSQHAPLFFGREAELAELRADLDALDRLGRPRLLLVVGASGSGKSSLVLAGLGPALQREGGWDVRRFRPGADPAAALDAALAGLGAGRTLLVADQLEELFTQTPTAEAREALARRLWGLASDPASGVTVVGTLRVDFLGRCEELTVERGGLRLDRVAADEAHRLLLSQMDRAQLRQVIERPAALVGLGLEPGLAERILDDVEGQPGALPLLQYTLDLLWQRRQGGLLTQRAYGELGGVVGALSGMGEAIHAAVPPGEQAQLRRLMVRLVSAPDAGPGDTRQRVPLDGLRPRRPDAAADFDAALARVEAARLVAREEGEIPTVELAHEALLRRWPRLQQWLAEDRHRLAELAELEEWARQWRQYGGLLESADKLGFAQRVAGRSAEDLSPDAHALVTQSAARAAHRRRTERRIRVGVGAAALGFLALALVAWREASENGVLATEANDRAAQLEIGTRRSRDAVRVSVATTARGDATRGVRVLREAESAPLSHAWRQAALFLLHRSISAQVYRGHGAPITSLTTHPVQGLIASASENGQVRLWTRDAPEAVASLPGYDSAVLGVEFDATGQRLLTRERAGAARIWPADGQGPPRVLPSTTGPLRAAHLSRDGARALIVDGGGVARIWRADGAGDPQVLAQGVTDAVWSWDGAEILTAGEDGVARRWDARSGGPLAQVAGPAGGLAAIVAGPGGVAALVGRLQTGWTGLWWPDGRTRGLTHVGADLAAFSPDARWLATGGDGVGGLRLWSLADPSQDRAQPDVHDGVLSLAWSADGALLAAGHRNGDISLHAMGGGAPLTLAGHRGAVTALRFDPTQRALYSGSRDGELRRWDVVGDRAPPGLLGLESGGILAWSADGGQLAATDASAQTRAWRLDRPLASTRLSEATALAWGPQPSLGDAGGRLRPDARHEAFIPMSGWLHLLSWSMDGRRLAAATLQGALRILSVQGQELARLDRPDAGPTAMAWAPDGVRLAVAWSDGLIRILGEDPAAPHVVLRGVDQPARHLVWHGEALLSVHADHARRWRADGAGEAEILAPELGPPLMVSPGPGGAVRVMALNGDGVRIDQSTRAEPLRPDGPPDLAAFSPDGTRWAAALADHLVQVEAEGAVYTLEGHESGLVALSWAPDGRRLATLDARGDLRLWQVEATDEALLAALWAITDDCGSPEEREADLALTPDVARSTHADCLARVEGR